MLRILPLLFTVILSITMSSFISVASDNDKSECEIDSSRSVGELFITSNNKITSLAKWENASLGFAQTCFNLKGDISAYLFPIINEDKEVGRIVVGNSLYNYRVFEASQVPIPEIPDMPELKNSIQRNLDIDVSVIYTNKPNLLYLGYCKLYALYDTEEGTDVAFDLWQREMRLTENLKDTLLSQAQYQTLQDIEGGSTSKTWSEVDIDTVPPREQLLDHDCGPTSGAMISEYYRNEWDCVLPNWDVDHDELYDDMDCDPMLGVWPKEDAKNGFITYMNRYGYPFSGSCLSPSSSYDFETYIQPKIDEGHPIMILFYISDYADYHWCTIRGYGNYQGTDSLYVNNPWYDWGPDYVSWIDNFDKVSLAMVWPTNYYSIDVDTIGNGSITKIGSTLLSVKGE